MKIGLASDHGGFELKEIIKNHIKDRYEITDYGILESKSVDYPDYGKLLAENVIKNKVELGIAFCGTGIGISIACNKVKGIRAALCSTTFDAEMSKKHNNANILCLGGRTIGIEIAKQIVDVFLKEKFEGGRHQDRLNKIKIIEEETKCQK